MRKHIANQVKHLANIAAGGSGVHGDDRGDRANRIGFRSVPGRMGCGNGINSKTSTFDALAARRDFILVNALPFVYVALCEKSSNAVCLIGSSVGFLHV
jgi:hypothetical protein